jgi:aminopeptidase N
MHIDLQVDFGLRQLRGTVELHIKDKSDSGDKLVLDTKGLHIEGVMDPAGNELPYDLGSEDAILGSALEIALPQNATAIIVHYKTPPGAAALQWLDPVQTEDKTDPFLFTQSQAILARSWLPVQDSPGIRFSYTADIQVPSGLLALMSAQNPQAVSGNGSYHFAMKQPIPAYLMSLAVGKLEFAPVGNRTGIYAEPSVIEKAQWEFAETEKMLEIAEKLYGEYQWERYDLLILPSSFPFGGMENPRLTFATPTIIAGDRSLTSLVAHELAHSWSGNLVTNATWNDFWLNEGFTVYFERRIMEKLYGSSFSEMMSSLSQQDLTKEVQEFLDSGKASDTRLKLQLEGRDPDEGVTTIAYDKGYFFLRYLEGLSGRKNFDAFLSSYFEAYAFRSNHTAAFVEYLKTNLFEKFNVDPAPDLEEWIYGEGLPASMPYVKSERFVKVDLAQECWQQQKDVRQLHTADWSAFEWMHFIRSLPDDTTAEDLHTLDQAFQLTDTGNAEILGIWLVRAVQCWYEAAFPQLRAFLIHTGRRKFLVPVYTELIKTGRGRSLAADIYRAARPNYHYVSRNSIDKLLNYPA